MLLLTVMSDLDIPNSMPCPIRQLPLYGQAIY